MWAHLVDGVAIHLFYFLGIMAIEASADFCCHVGTNISTDFLLNFCCCKFAMVENIDDLLFALVVDDSPVASHSIIKLL